MGSDVTVHEEVSVGRARQRTALRAQLPLLAVISVGGGVGSEARYGMSLLLPTMPGHFPWSTFLTNVLGCFCIGALMVLITEVWSAHRLLRPFLGVGVLGGFTTFSTYAVEVRGLLQPGSVPVAFGYLVGTVTCALLAVLAGVALTRWTTGVVGRSGKGV